MQRSLTLPRASELTQLHKVGLLRDMDVGLECLGLSPNEQSDHLTRICTCPQAQSQPSLLCSNEPNPRAGLLHALFTRKRYGTPLSGRPTMLRYTYLSSFLFRVPCNYAGGSN